MDVLAWDKYTCTFASSAGGQIKMLKWAHHNGCPLGTRERACIYAGCSYDENTCSHTV